MRHWIGLGLLISCSVALLVDSSAAWGQQATLPQVSLLRPEIQSAARSAATIHARLLIGKGIRRIGSVDLERYVQEVESVRYFSSAVTLSTLGRLGHRYNVAERAVILSGSLMDPTPDNDGRLRGQLAVLHETLGALGYMDDEYEISSTIAALESSGRALTYAPQLIVSDRRRLANPTQSQRRNEPLEGRGQESVERWLQAHGGVTGAGGGGDPLAIVIKSTLLWEAIERSSPARELNFFINSIGIETFVSRNGVPRSCPYDRASAASQTIVMNEGALKKIYVSASCAGELNRASFRTSMLELMRGIQAGRL